VSCVSRSGPDEREFIAAVEAHTRSQGHHIVFEQSDGAIDLNGAWLTPKHPRNAVLALYRRVLDGGGRMLMSGHAGDVVFGNHVYSDTHVMAALENASFLEAFRIARRAALV